MIRDFVYGHIDTVIPISFSFPLKNPRTSSLIGFTVDTFDGRDYQLDLGNGIQFTASSKPVGGVNDIYNFNTTDTGSTDLYIKKEAVKGLSIIGGSHSFDTEILEPFSRLQNLYLEGEITTDITSIPNNVSTLSIGSGTEITSDYNDDDRSFKFTPINLFRLNNNVGTGLTGSGVDNLLRDLLNAQFIGQKRVEITGINSPPTDISLVTSLQNLGVTVVTN
jgi:hypothetical protein